MVDQRISELTAIISPLSADEFAINELGVSKKITLEEIQGGIIEGSIPFVGQTGIFKQDNSNFFWDDVNNRLGIGTSSPNTVLEVRGVLGGNVGGFSSGQLHVTNSSTSINASAVITGHNLNGGNKQLWYLGSASSSDDNVTFINRQNAGLFLGTNDTAQLTILAPGNIGIGTITPDSTALLELSSTTQGFLPPRMTEIQRDAISSPATGLGIYNTTSNLVNVFDGTVWGVVGSGGGIYAGNGTIPTATVSTLTDTWSIIGGQVGIGTTVPEGTLHILTGILTAVNPTSQADDLIVQSDGDTGITIFSSDLNVSSIVFGTPSGTGSEGARLRWNFVNDLFQIATTETNADISLAPGFLAEAMRLKPDGKVGIGTDLPQALLHIKTGDAGAVGAPVGADELLIEGSANTGITIISPATSFSQIIFGSPDGLGGEGAKLRWKDSTSLFEIHTTEVGADIAFSSGAANEVMRIKGDGVVIIGAQIPSGTAIFELVSTTKTLMLARWTAGQEITNTGSLGTGDKGLLWFNTTSNFLKMWNGSSVVAIA